MLMIASAASGAIIYTDKDVETVEAAVGYPSPATTLPSQKISITAGDCVRFGITSLPHGVAKTNTVNAYVKGVESSYYSAGNYDYYLSALDSSVVFYGFGGGTTESPHISTYSSTSEDIVFSNKGALNTFLNSTNSFLSGETCWYDNIDNSPYPGIIKKIYYGEFGAKPHVSGSVDNSYTMFKAARRNIYNAYPSYDDLLEIFFDLNAENVNTSHALDSFYTNLINNMGLNTTQAQQAMGYWLGNYVDLDSNSNTVNSGCESAFQVACTGSDISLSSGIDGHAISTAEDLAYQRMLSLLTVYCLAIKSGDYGTSIEAIDMYYSDYKNAIEELVNPAYTTITYAPVIENTVCIKWNPSGYADVGGYMVSEYDVGASGNLEMFSRYKNGGWSFDATPRANSEVTITLTTGQQLGMITSKGDNQGALSLFFTSNGGGQYSTTDRAYATIKSVTKNSTWSQENKLAGINQGIRYNFSQYGGYVDFADAGANPILDYGVWGYRDQYHSGSIHGSKTVYQAFYNYPFSGYGGTRPYANVQSSTTCGITNAALSWEGRDGLVDSVVDRLTEADMTSLFTMYQYVYGFNFYCPHNSEHTYGNQNYEYRDNWLAGEIEVSSASHYDCGHGSSGTNGHWAAGSYGGWAGTGSASAVTLSATTRTDYHSVSTNAKCFQAVVGMDIYGFKTFVTGAIWQPQLRDVPMEYWVTSEAYGEGSTGLSDATANTKTYGFLNDDNYQIKNTIHLQWAQDATSQRTLRRVRNTIKLARAFNSYGTNTGVCIWTTIPVYEQSDKLTNLISNSRMAYESGYYKRGSTATYSMGLSDYNTDSYPERYHYLSLGNGSNNPRNVRGDEFTVSVNSIFQGTAEFTYVDDIDSGIIYPTETVTHRYSVTVSMRFVGNSGQSNLQNMTCSVRRGKTDTTTEKRTTQYFEADGSSVSMNAYAELKSNDPTNENYEVMAGVPTINSDREQETLYFSVGGTPYKAIFNYHIEFFQPLTASDGQYLKHCNYMVIDSYEIWCLDSAELISCGDLIENVDADGNIDLQLQSNSSYRLGVKFVEHHADAAGNNTYNIYGDYVQILSDGANGTIGWTKMFGTMYNLKTDGAGEILSSGSSYNSYHATMAYGDEGQLGNTKVESQATHSVFGDVSISDNTKSTTSNPISIVIDTSKNFDGDRGFLGTQTNKYITTSTDESRAPMYIAGLDIKDYIENKEYGGYTAKLYYKKYTRTNTSGSLDSNATTTCQYNSTYSSTTNPVIVHDPVAITFSTFSTSNGYTDNLRSYLTTTESSGKVTDISGEPKDQRVKGANLDYYTTKNNLFVDYDFALKLDFTADYSINTAKDIESTQSVLGYGFSNTSTGKLCTAPWIKYIWVKFPFDVSYDSVDYDANTWILIESDLGTNVNWKIYDGFHIPLSQSEMDGSVTDLIEVRVQGYNVEWSESRAQTGPKSVDTDITGTIPTNNKTRTTVGSKNQYTRRQSSVTVGDVDIVGHVGALTMLDTGDFRFSNYFKQTTAGWLVDGLVKKVDSSKQFGIIADADDVLRKNNSDFSLLNPYSTFSFIDGVETAKFPLSTSVLKNYPDKDVDLSGLANQPLKLGYSSYMSLETVGNYYGDSSTLSEIQIVPRYYVVDDGTASPVDVYVEVNGTYVMVNDNDSSDVDYEYFYTLDWLNEKVRRMYSTGEASATTSNLVAPFNVIPSDEETVHLGTLDYIFLRDSARTFFGNQEFSDVTWQDDKQAQRWHFTLGLPSGSKFVPSGEDIDLGDSLRGTEGNCITNEDGTIITTLEVLAKGDVWTLRYVDETGEDTYSDIDPDETPVIPYEPETSATSDITLKGTH